MAGWTKLANHLELCRAHTAHTWGELSNVRTKYMVIGKIELSLAQLRYCQAKVRARTSDGPRVFPQLQDVHEISFVARQLTCLPPSTT